MSRIISLIENQKAKAIMSEGISLDIHPDAVSMYCDTTAIHEITDKIYSAKETIASLSKDFSADSLSLNHSTKSCKIEFYKGRISAFLEILDGAEENKIFQEIVQFINCLDQKG